jgi:DDE superfamily endonuclease/Restriction endonuclease
MHPREFEVATRDVLAVHGFRLQHAGGTRDRGVDLVGTDATGAHTVLARREGWSHVNLDGTLIETDRVHAKGENGHDLWYSGKHKQHGGNVQVLTEPGGFPVWTSPVEPGNTHDITAARAHVLPALYPAATAGLPTLTDKGYTGAGIGIQVPVKGRHLAPDTATRNQLINALRAPGERGNAILKTRWTALQRLRLCPRRIGDITAAALVLSTLERGRY